MSVSLLRAAVCGALLVCAWGCSGSDGDDDDGDRAPPLNVGPGPTTKPHQTAGESWTVLVYMVADNDLEPFALMDLAEMAAVGQSGAFRFVVQADRSEGYTADGIGNLPNWTTAKRLVVEPGGFQEVADLGELNMGDPGVLADFITWGIQSYPADRYALIFWDHGAAWPGFGGDGSTVEQDMLSVAELKLGVATGLAEAGEEHFALLGFDACLMATWEVARALAPYGEYLLASQELEPGHGWDYRSFQRALQNPAVDPVTLGADVIQGFIDQSDAERTSANITLSLVDLFALPRLEEGIGLLAQAGASAVGLGSPTLAKQRARALAFGETPDPSQSTHMVDVGDLAKRLAAADDRYAEALAYIRAGLDQAVLTRGYGPITSDSTGLSLYFPPSANLYRADYDGLTEVAGWRQFLQSYYGGALASAIPTFTDPGKVATHEFGTDGMLYVQGTLAAGASRNIASAQLLYGLGTDTDVFILGDLPAEFDDEHVLGGWELQALTVSQGAEQAYAYLSLEAPPDGSLFARIAFAYAEPGGRQGYVLRQLVFDANVTLTQDTYYLVTDEGVGELTPAPGSTLTPLVQYLDGNGDLQWGAGGAALDATAEISLAFAAMAPGTSVFGALTIQDAAGRGDLVYVLTEVP